jgi:hypothetical protein
MFEVMDEQNQLLCEVPFRDAINFDQAARIGNRGAARRRSFSRDGRSSCDRAHTGTSRQRRHDQQEHATGGAPYRKSPTIPAGLQLSDSVYSATSGKTDATHAPAQLSLKAA